MRISISIVPIHFAALLRYNVVVPFEELSDDKQMVQNGTSHDMLLLSAIINVEIMSFSMRFVIQSIRFSNSPTRVSHAFASHIGKRPTGAIDPFNSLANWAIDPFNLWAIMKKLKGSTTMA